MLALAEMRIERVKKSADTEQGENAKKRERAVMLAGVRKAARVMQAGEMPWGRSAEGGWEEQGREVLTVSGSLTDLTPSRRKHFRHVLQWYFRGPVLERKGTG